MIDFIKGKMSDHCGDLKRVIADLLENIISPDYTQTGKLIDSV